MAIKDPARARVEVFITDPWDFGSKNGVGPFYGNVVDSDEKKILIRLDKPLGYSDTEYVYLLGEKRHEGDSIGAMSGEAIPMNFVLLEGPSLNRLSDITADRFKRGSAVVGTAQLTVARS